MSNRRKPKSPHLRLLKGGKGEPIASSGLVEKVVAPDDEKVLLKTVPATVEDEEGVKHVVGEAFLYDDASVQVNISDDAPQWAVDKIKAEENKFGYTIGGTDGSP